MLNKTIRIAAFILLLLTLGCETPGGNFVSVSAPQAIAYRLVTVDPNATATPTPFQPMARTPTFIPTDMPDTPTPTFTPSPTSTSTPKATSTPPLPNFAGVPSGTKNILVLGSDERPGGGFRTDVIILVSLNKNAGTVTMVSFPRDLYVYIPGWTNNRINTAQQFGFATTQAMFQQNFNLRIDHYVLTNFNNFVGIINSLGGIMVHAEQNLTDRCDFPKAVNGYCSVGPGNVPMNGEEALWYVRSRHSTSDFDRTRRAQEVMKAIFTRTLRFDAIRQAPTLYNKYLGAIDTDMSLADVLTLMPYATKVLNADDIRRFAIGPAQVYNAVTADGAQVLMPIPGAIQAVLQDALNP